MVVGFNHNFRYKGEVYHIQTEDSGVKSPNIVTLLYHGGTILASKKTSYADIVKVDNLGQVVEELMKEQHKNMLRSLKAGEFDAIIERFHAGKQVTNAEKRPEESGPNPERATATVSIATTPVVKPVASMSPPPVVCKAPSESKATTVAPEKPRRSAIESSLDEVILSYLLKDDK